MQNQYSKTKSMVEAGLLSALIVIIMLFNVYVPIFSAVGTILPIPITLLFIRHDFKVSISAVVVSMILIGVLYSPIPALIAGISYGIIGITLGYCIKHKFKNSLIMISLTIASLISMIFGAYMNLILIFRQSVYEIIKEYIDMIKGTNEITKDFGNQMGMPTSQFDQMTKALEMFTPEYMMFILPAILLIGAFISAFINYTVTRSILKKMKYEVNPRTSFDKVYLDNRLGALIIIIFCIGIILYGRGFSVGNYIYNSAFLILNYAFMLDAVALAVYYLKNKFGLSKGFIILIIVFAMISQLIMIFLYLGIADMIFDFRKLDPNRMLRQKSK